MNIHIKCELIVEEKKNPSCHGTFDDRIEEKTQTASCLLFSVHSTLFSVHCTLFSVHCMFLSSQCVPNTVYHCYIQIYKSHIKLSAQYATWIPHKTQIGKVSSAMDVPSLFPVFTTS